MSKKGEEHKSTLMREKSVVPFPHPEGKGKKVDSAIKKKKKRSTPPRGAQSRRP